jgi:hypothetical protein
MIDGQDASAHTVDRKTYNVYSKGGKKDSVHGVTLPCGICTYTYLITSK